LVPQSLFHFDPLLDPVNKGAGLSVPCRVIQVDEVASHLLSLEARSISSSLRRRNLRSDPGLVFWSWASIRALSRDRRLLDVKGVNMVLLLAKQARQLSVHREVQPAN
jgi:hypothetical protein